MLSSASSLPPSVSTSFPRLASLFSSTCSAHCSLWITPPSSLPGPFLTSGETSRKRKHRPRVHKAKDKVGCGHMKEEGSLLQRAFPPTEPSGVQEEGSMGPFVTLTLSQQLKVQKGGQEVAGSHGDWLYIWVTLSVYKKWGWGGQGLPSPAKTNPRQDLWDAQGFVRCRRLKQEFSGRYHG